jgi:hypothetical protein
MQPKIINYEIEKIFRGNKKYFITVLIRDNREHRVRINTDRLTEQLMFISPYRYVSFKIQYKAGDPIWIKIDDLEPVKEILH